MTGQLIEATLTLTVTANEDDIRELCRVAGKTERVYIVTAGQYGHIEVDDATYEER